jgi:integrase
MTNKKNLTGYIKYMTDEELETIEKYVELNYSLKWRAIFYTLIFQGLRISEVCRIKRCDFHSGNKLRVLLSKSHEIIDRTLHPRIIKTMTKYLELGEFKPQDYIFPPDPNNNIGQFKSLQPQEYMNPQSVRRKFGILREECNLIDIYNQRRDGTNMNRITLHTFRNRWLSKAWAITKDPIAVQRAIGHKKFETTARYITPTVQEEEFISEI